MKYITLKDFSLSDYSIFDETFNPDDLKFVERDEPDIEMGSIIDTSDETHVDFSEQCVVDFLEFMSNSGYIMPYHEYREQRINEILE